MKDSVSTYCHFWASGGGSVNRNKHNNKAKKIPENPPNLPNRVLDCPTLKLRQAVSVLGFSLWLC